MWDAPLSEQPEAVRNAYQEWNPTYFADRSGGQFHQWLRTPQAAEKLRPLGIPGIKYFDGGSRAAGEGTRNFVIFDGDTAKILKRE